MKWAYNSAPNGNIGQMGWLATAGNSATNVSFSVAVGYGPSQAAAIAAVDATLGGKHRDDPDNGRKTIRAR